MYKHIIDLRLRIFLYFYKTLWIESRSSRNLGIDHFHTMKYIQNSYSFTPAYIWPIYLFRIIKWYKYFKWQDSPFKHVKSNRSDNRVMVSITFIFQEHISLYFVEYRVDAQLHLIRIKKKYILRVVYSFDARLIYIIKFQLN